ncbi:MAG: hypothetical protein VR78_01890 [Hoeflea sp. BRH_c9]|nr:MAG: hypothetical protein VR78_01890 [Hoeflea sp. BRH_c9]
MKRFLKSFAATSAIALCFAVSSIAPANAQSKDELVWGDTLPSGLDPHVVYDVYMQTFMLNTYDGLYRYLGNPIELVPWLATSHEVSDDGMTWTFNLRQDATFHDGSPLTADDVVYSFKRLLEIGRGPSGALAPVLKPENITKVDDSTVQFLLNEPYAPFLATLPLVSIVNQELVTANEVNGDNGTAWLASNEAGSGAYIFDPDTYVPQEKVDLKRNKTHFYGWSDNADPIDVVRAYPVKETSTRVLALMRDDIQATDGYLPPDQVAKIDSTDGVSVRRDESMRVMVIRMNNSKPPFDNINFRKCVSYAFQYDGFINVVLKGLVSRNSGPIPNNLWGVPEDATGYTYDPDAAKKYCDKAREEGAPLDRTLEIHIQSELDQTTQAAQLLQQGLSEYGVNVELVASTWASLTSSTGSAESSPDMWVHWVSTYFVDPENWIGQMYDSSFHGTWKASSWYKNAKVDELLRQGRKETDRNKRNAAYGEAYKIIVDEAADLWIYNTIALRGVSDRLTGIKFSPVGSGAEFRWMSLAD